jgi:hypothetical protein
MSVATVVFGPVINSITGPKITIATDIETATVCQCDNQIGKIIYNSRNVVYIKYRPISDNC